jgi:hypothetical protein
MVRSMPRRPRSPVTTTDANRALTSKERALVNALVEAAADKKAIPSRETLGTLAGYGKGETARVSASRALRRPPVRNAIAQGIRENASVDVAAMYITLRNAGLRAPSARDRIAAASKVLDLAGLGGGTTPSGPPVVVQITLNDPQAQDGMRALLALADARGGG